jgi:hypothetical protein
MTKIIKSFVLGMTGKKRTPMIGLNRNTINLRGIKSLEKRYIR